MSFEPFDRASRIRLVDAEVPSTNAGSEVIGERRLALTYLRDRCLDALGHGRARPVARRSRRAVTTAEADRGRNLLGDRIDFEAQALAAAAVVESLRFLEFLAQFLEALLVRRLRRLIQDPYASVGSVQGI